MDRIAKIELSFAFPDVNKPPPLFTEIHCLGRDPCEGAGHCPGLPPCLSLPALSVGCWWRTERVKLWCCAGTSTWQQCWAWAYPSGKLCRTVCRAGAECPFSTGKLLARGWVGYSGSNCTMLGSSLNWTGFPFAVGNLCWCSSSSLPPSARSWATHPFLPQCVEEPEDLIACYLRSLCRSPLICRPILLDFSLDRKPSKILQPGEQALLTSVILCVGRKGGAVSAGWESCLHCPQSKIDLWRISMELWTL